MILKEGVSFDGFESDSSTVSTKVDYSKNDTDVIISHYENKLNERIADKTVKASKEGAIPSFTKEEWLYLNKKSSPANPNTEITVIAPAPTITLKKGNTEINVKNAAELVRKMQEKYPNGMSEDSREDVLRQPFIEKSIEEGLKNVLPVAPTATPPIKTVNSNAYEIRSDVLKMSINFIKWQTEMSVNNMKESKSPYINIPKIDDVLDIANRFYSFVENRKR